ncbi:hypothetical protein ACTWP6_10080 [Mycobacterium sp. 4D054]|uniref:hypothetical protein n=1 Tax=unclassified Mycobacterium TaxID=2642494 RepID=UPI0021B22337|nr:hypothetical protein [Mycobacterium sp. SMC-8]UXA13843.1 hypothetical protein KXD97_08720 [Mycobacterium sp. SMC-8]
MLSVVRRILGYEMTVAEWIGTALLVGAPYGILGVLVTVLRPDHIAAADGGLKVFAVAGSLLFWPILLVTGVCIP